MSNGSIKAVVLCSNSIASIIFDEAFNIMTNYSINLNYNATTLKCINSTYQCLIGTTNGRILLFNLLTSSLANIFSTNVNSSIALIKILSISNNKYKIYAGFDNGMLNQYKLTVNFIQADRSCGYFKGEQINAIETYPDSKYLIVTDRRGNVSQIDIDNGTLVDSINVKPYLANKTNTAMSILFSNASSFYIYNTLNSAIFFVTTTSPTSQNTIVLNCFDLYFYNNTLQECSPCSRSCATCDQLNGSCIDCIGQYFNDNGQCLSCFYNSRGLTDKFN